MNLSRTQLSDEAVLAGNTDGSDLTHVPPGTGEESSSEKQAAWDNLLPTERNTLKFYLNEIGKTPLLTPEEETRLARRIRTGDEAARAAMIKANLRLVVRIARDYENYGLPLLDLISEGNIGLMKAVERFDADRGGKLSTYAAWWIRQALKRALANHGKTIRLPMHLVDRIGAMRKIINKLHDELHREPTDDEIALVMEIPVRKVVHMKTVATRAASLDAPVGAEGDATFGDFIGDESQSSPFESLRNTNAASEIRRIVDRLDPREAEIIRLRFGLTGDDPMTLEQVGERYKLTRERIRQVEHLAIMKLRRLMADLERQRTGADLREEAIESARRREIASYLAEKTREAEERRRRLDIALSGVTAAEPASAPGVTPTAGRKDSPLKAGVARPKAAHPSPRPAKKTAHRHAG